MCKARIGLIWVILSWSVPLLLGLGCEFIAYRPDMTTWFNVLWPQVLLSVGITLPFALIGGGYLWKARTTLLPEFTFFPKQTIVKLAILPAFFIIFLFFVFYLPDTSLHGLAETGKGLVVVGTIGTALCSILLLELSIVMLIAKRYRKNES